jgi:hypothetical protein
MPTLTPRGTFKKLIGSTSGPAITTFMIGTGPMLDNHTKLLPLQVEAWVVNTGSGEGRWVTLSAGEKFVIDWWKSGSFSPAAMASMYYDPNCEIDYNTEPIAMGSLVDTASTYTTEDVIPSRSTEYVSAMIFTMRMYV